MLNGHEKRYIDKDVGYTAEETKIAFLDSKTCNSSDAKETVICSSMLIVHTLHLS
jgi:hypothetical protein